MPFAQFLPSCSAKNGWNSPCLYTHLCLKKAIDYLQQYSIFLEVRVMVLSMMLYKLIDQDSELRKMLATDGESR